MNLSSDTAYIIASNMTYEELKNWCSVNHEIAKYCDEPRFQQLKKTLIIDKWTTKMLNIGHMNSYEFIIRDENSINHKIIFSRLNKKAITITETLVATPFTHSLIYQVYFKLLFKAVPTFSDVISNNRPKYNIMLSHRNTLEDYINKLKDNIKVYETVPNSIYYASSLQYARKHLQDIMEIPKSTKDEYTFIKQNIDPPKLRRIINLLFSNYTPTIIHNKPRV